MTRYVAQGIAGTRGVIRAARSEQLTFIAASLAYYAFVSVFPLLLLGIVILSLIGGPVLADRLAARASEQVGGPAGDIVYQTLTGADARGSATVVGVVAFAWSGLKVFRGLDVAFSQVYGTEVAESFLRQVGDALTALAAVAGAVALTLIVGYLVAIPGVPLRGLLATPALAVGLTLAFLPLYYLFPDTDVSLREVIPGAVFAGVGWTILGALFSVYATKAGAFQGYGLVGAILLLVTWFYFGGLVLLLGAVVNAVLAGRIEDAEIPAEISESRHMTRKTRDVGDDTDVTDSDPGGRRAMDAGDGGAGPTGAGGRPPRSDEEEKEKDSSPMAGAAEGVPEDTPKPEVQELREQLRDLRGELREFEDDVEARTLHREEVERDLRKYVRSRVRRGHARGWGPYLVLLYGTAMTLGAFVYLGGGWAILAMLVIWLSTLGLYVLMLLVGTMLGVAGVPGRLASAIGRFRG